MRIVLIDKYGTIGDKSVLTPVEESFLKRIREAYSKDETLFFSGLAVRVFNIAKPEET